MDKFYAKYREIQQSYYNLIKTNVVFRFLSILFLAIFAPIIVVILWAPAVASDLIGFYAWIPEGLKGKGRTVLDE